MQIPPEILKLFMRNGDAAVGLTGGAPVMRAPVPPEVAATTPVAKPEANVVAPVQKPEEARNRFYPQGFSEKLAAVASAKPSGGGFSNLIGDLNRGGIMGVLSGEGNRTRALAAQFGIPEEIANSLSGRELATLVLQAQRGQAPEYDFITAPDGTVLRTEKNSGSMTALGKFAKPEEQKLPDGFARDATGALKPIPGGPADPAYLGEKAAATQSSKPTEAQNRNVQLYSVIEPEISDPDFDKRFRSLATIKDGAANAFGQNWAMSPDAQRASGALRTVISSYLYSVSGATANPGEVESQAAILTPKPTDDATTIEDKLRRVKTMAEAVKTATGAATGRAATDAATSGAAKSINTPEDYQRLPPGSRYIAPDGSMRTKQ